MAELEQTLEWALLRRGVSRRDFLKFSTLMAGTLALPLNVAPRIAQALAATKRPPVVWLEFQDCAGCTESFLRASRPTVAEIVLDVLSVDYHETIMAAAGHQAEEAKAAALKDGGHLVVVEGAVTSKDGGIYCTIGGRASDEILREAVQGAAAIIAVGNCATFGGLPAANPNPTGAVGVDRIVSGVPVINLPGCPLNVVNLTATVVYYLTFKGLPALDRLKRPLFAYGKRIHDNCERRAHFDAGQYVEAWGDEGHRRGWCLYKMGCKGPETYHNCPTVRWNEGVSWPVQSGHGCIGCSEPGFWDTMTPFYKRLPNVPGFPVEVTADQVGIGLTALAAAGVGAHAVASLARHKVIPALQERSQTAAAEKEE
ncbi:MAG: hydrogenase small subunit [Chloroflexi bacterium]|nr:hydrogenase small subunit [Chloroflexota bacterium]